MILKNTLFILMVLLIAQISYSQTGKLISGKLYAKERIPQGVKIINLVSEQETSSNEKGEFKILAKKDDLLVFSSINFDYVRKIIETDDYEKGEITIDLVEKPEQLEEVKITNYSSINAVSLGILSKPAKEFTPAERRLETAGKFRPIQLIQIPFGGMPLDPLINKISGRRKKLEKELKIERKEMLIKKMDNDFSESFYLKNLKLKKEQIRAFQFYCAEDGTITKTLKSNNKTLIMIELTALAIKFKKLNEKN